MTFRGFLLVIALATIAAWAGWIVVLVSIDPSRAGMLGLAFFYLSLGSAAFGTIALSGIGLRVWLRRDEVVSRHVSRSFRQAGLLTAVLMAALILLPADLFRWWTISILAIAAGLAELGFVGASRSEKRPGSERTA